MRKHCTQLQDRRSSNPVDYWVSPEGSFFTAAGRSKIFGNRGILRVEGGIDRAWDHIHWICCVGCDRLTGYRPPRRYTRLNFHDEAVALAVGHRPCARCRHSEYRRFYNAWLSAGDDHGFGALDSALHTARLADARVEKISNLPDYCFVTLRDETGAFLLVSGQLRRWSPSGYAAGRIVSAETQVQVLTPQPALAALMAGYKLAMEPKF